LAARQAGRLGVAPKSDARETHDIFYQISARVWSIGSVVGQKKSDNDIRCLGVNNGVVSPLK